MTEAQPLPPAGWYPDGVTPAVLRWFDGAAWTEHTAPDPAAQVAAPQPAPVPAPAPTLTPLPGGPIPDAPTHRPPGAHAARAAGAPAHARHRTAHAPTAGAGAAQPVRALAGATAGAYGATPYAAGPAYATAAPAGPWYPEPARVGAGPRDAVHWLLPTGRSWQSIVAGYVGLFALLIWPLGPFAVWFGLWGLRRARTGGHGRGRAVFAVVVGAAATALLAYLLASGALTT
ncbi:DUF2510 domain-containing protein [Cellulomonas sp. GbtcB1]|uniref:DUF2510 domain-containing protein n=1 Tax=Cellulomonas sp. GbtcB1 TaxID=2824746 RepID=UPI001C30839E|nr:DUF2510 domain-containing protein [Cellulomonas sp. GbtcB1]